MHTDGPHGAVELSRVHEQMKFLRAVRLDDSDDQVYLASARAGEPVVAGSFLWAFSDEDPGGFRGKRLNAFRSGFLGTVDFGHCTLAAVGEISDLEYKQLIERLAQYMVDHYGAPSLVAALPSARAEAEFTASLCDRDPAHFIALERDLDTISGLRFYQHAETPGLGGEIDNPRWIASWEGKELYDDDGALAIEVLKGQAPAGYDHQIDGLSGATLTTRGVHNLVRFWMGDDGFGPFLDQLGERIDAGEFDQAGQG